MARESIGEAVLELRTDDRRYDRGIRQAHSRARKLDSQFVSVGDRLTMVATRAIALGAVAFGSSRFVTGLLDARIELERIENTLQSSLGSLEVAEEEFGFVADEADRLGLNLSALARQYSQLSAASRGTKLEGQATKDIFIAISEASTVLGLSMDETRGALRAIDQMISKGNVQAEELRGQLGERLPGAFQIAARAMGVTTRELNEMLVNGEVLAEDLLPALAAELRRTFGPQVPQAAQALRADIERLKNAVFLLQGELGGATGRGLLPTIEGVTEALEAMRTASDDAVESSGESVSEWAAGTAVALTTLADAGRVTGFAVGHGLELIGKRFGALGAAANFAVRGDLEGARLVLEEFNRDFAQMEQDLLNFDPQMFTNELLNRQREAMSGDGIEPIDTSQFPRRRRSLADEMLQDIDTSAFDKMKRDQQLTNEIFREAERIYQDTRTPLEAYTAEIGELRDFLGAGLIDQQTFNRAVAQAGEGYADAMEKGKEAAKELEAITDQAARNMQDAFADFLFNPFEEGLDGMLSSFLTVIQRMIAEAAAAQIIGAMFQSAGGPGAFLGNALSNVLPGFAQGGSFTIGGPTGVDKTPVMFMGSRGEQVDITPKGGGGRSQVVIAPTINAPGADAGTVARIEEILKARMVPDIVNAATNNTLNSLRRPNFA